MPEPLTIAVAQPPCVALDVAANATAHAAAVRAAGTRVVVFPELSLTGYELDAPAVDGADPRLAELVAACAERGSIALAGAPVAGHGGSRAIGVLAVDGEGAHVAYRKLWLGDAELAAGLVPGEDPVVFAVDGWRLGLAVCKDTGVAEHAALTAALGIDAYVAGVVHHADDRDVNAERAERVVAAHDVWVAIASCAGPTGGGYDETAGGSGIWGPDGVRHATTGRTPGEVARATLTARR